MKNDKYSGNVGRGSPTEKKNTAKTPHAEQRYPKRAHSGASEGCVAGRNAVRELIRTDSPIDKIFVARGARDGSLSGIVADARERKIPVIEVDEAKLDAMAGGAVHQGIAAFAAEKEYSTLDDVFEIARERGEKPLIVIAENITDPGNLGAIIRSAECSGAHGVIIPKRHSVGLSPVVSKASAGAISHMAIVKETNLAAAVNTLKSRGVWVYAADADGKPYDECDFTSPTAIILGNEGDGVSRLLKERADGVVSIPMYGKVDSLNVSCAAAVLLSEAARQMRRQRVKM